MNNKKTAQEIQRMKNIAQGISGNDEIETLRQQVKDYENRIIGVGSVAINSVGRDAYEGCREDLLDWKKRALQAEAKLAALKAGQGEPIGYFCDVNSLTPEQGKRIEQVVESAKDDPDVFPLFATPQTCFSAGDMADAAAKAFQEGAESNRAATDELLAALKSMFNEIHVQRIRRV